MQLDDTKPYIIVLEELLSPAECASLVRFIDDNEPSQAPVMTINGEAYKPDIRNNQRVMTTDIKLAEKIFRKAKHQIPESVFDYRAVGLNELFRCYRYKEGMRFKPHSDSCYERSENERSFYTFLIYLNEVELGGDTAFVVEPEVSISPKAGKGVLFQHPIVHEGCEVLDGVKYVLRTDVMYQRVYDAQDIKPS